MGSRMKVVFVFAGILKFKGRLLKQIRTLQKAGHECVLVHGRVEDELPDYSTYGFEVESIRLRRHPNGIINYLRHLRFNIQAARAIRRLSPGAVVCVELYGALSGALARSRNRGLRFVFDCNELFMHMGMRPLKRMMWRPIHSWIFRKADVITHAEEQRLLYCKAHYATRARHLLLENLPEAAGPMEKPRPVPAPPLRVVYVGALLPERCCEEVIRAFAAIPAGTATCDFIGFGAPDYEARLAAIMSESGAKHVRILPAVPHNRMRSTLHGYDVGLAFYENQNLNQYYCAPNKIYDYIACGLPTISNSYPGLVSVLEGNRVGVCVDEISASSIKTALDRIRQERSWEQIDARVKNRFSWEHQAPGYRALFGDPAGSSTPEQ